MIQIPADVLVYFILSRSFATLDEGYMLYLVSKGVYDRIKQNEERFWEHWILYKKKTLVDTFFSSIKLHFSAHVEHIIRDGIYSVISRDIGGDCELAGSFFPLYSFFSYLKFLNKLQVGFDEIVGYNVIGIAVVIADRYIPEFLLRCVNYKTATAIKYVHDGSMVSFNWKEFDHRDRWTWTNVDGLAVIGDKITDSSMIGSDGVIYKFTTGGVIKSSPN